MKIAIAPRRTSTSQGVPLCFEMILSAKSSTSSWAFFPSAPPRSLSSFSAAPPWHSQMLR
jgi:hypothetical protein